MTYNWQQHDWPDFRYDLSPVEDALLTLAEKTGRTSGLLRGLKEETQIQAMVDVMVEEAIKTSEIEGEYLSRKEVMSSIRKNLGLGQPIEQVKDKRAEGAAALMIDVRNSYRDALSKEKLCEWHQLIMTGSRGIKSGQWRSHKEPMQVISGSVGKPKVHFEAPPSSRVPKEMTRFIAWFNETAPGSQQEIKRPVVRAAVAHIYFESIHPFEDGNGRIGRALSEKALSQGIGQPVLLSLSRTIEANRKQYYEALQAGQQSNDLTAWVTWFVNMAVEAQKHAEEQIEFTLKKTKFFDRFTDKLNERQLKVMSRILEEGPKGFKAGLNTKKYIGITDTSKATATRDLQDLVEKRALVPFGGGRSTRYEANLEG